MTLFQIICLVKANTRTILENIQMIQHNFSWKTPVVHIAIHKETQKMEDRLTGEFRS